MKLNETKMRAILLLGAISKETKDYVWQYIEAVSNYFTEIEKKELVLGLIEKQMEEPNALKLLVSSAIISGKVADTKEVLDLMDKVAYDYVVCHVIMRYSHLDLNTIMKILQKRQCVQTDGEETMSLAEIAISYETVKGGDIVTMLESFGLPGNRPLKLIESARGHLDFFIKADHI